MDNPVYCGKIAYTVEENVEDIYLLLCEKDAKLLRKLYVELTGKPELVRLSTLGGWNSKYYAYTEEEAKQLILDYEKHDVPLDVMVIDTDWRSCENGWGYDINTKLFPDMKRFFDFAHSHGVEVMFNDHPEPVNDAQVFAPEEIEYRERNLQSLMNYEQKSLFALFGTYGLEMNPSLLTDDEKRTLSNTTELYKKYHKDVIENGTLYHLASPQTDNWYIMQCVNSSKTCSLVLLMNLLHEKECFRYLKLKGLDPDKRYKNNFDGCAFYGDYYMNVGFNFSGVWRDEFDCKLLILEEVETEE